jgi:signal transduction histidine kinase
MDSAIITAAAAVCGSLVGALGSLFGNLLSQRHHDRRGLFASRISYLEILYSDFITEAARLLVDALEHNTFEPKNLVSAYAMLSRIRLNSSPQILEAAEAVLKTIVEIYPLPNLAPEQIHVGNINGEEQLKRFSEICRRELESVERHF